MRKTSVGSLLANNLDIAFIDQEREVEKARYLK
jgi:shikimate kinase